jgi:hypothetical protein
MGVKLGLSHQRKSVRRLRVFENRVLRTKFGPKKGEVTGEWRKLHCGKLYNLYSSSGIIRRGLWHAWEIGEKWVKF